MSAQICETCEYKYGDCYCSPNSVCEDYKQNRGYMMKNIVIKGINNCSDLDRKINLSNGSIVIQKDNDKVIGVYYIVSFRDNKNKYQESTRSYCSLVNLDNGQMAFEERCSRVTTERRVLRHLTRAGFSYPYDPNSHEQDWAFENMRIQVYPLGDYKLELDLKNEQIIGGKRKNGEE